MKSLEMSVKYLKSINYRISPNGIILKLHVTSNNYPLCLLISAQIFQLNLFFAPIKHLKF